MDEHEEEEEERTCKLQMHAACDRLPESAAQSEREGDDEVRQTLLLRERESDEDQACCLLDGHHCHPCIYSCIYLRNT